MRSLICLSIFVFFCTTASAQSKNPKAQKYFDKAVHEHDLGNPDAALALLNKAVKKDPQFSVAYSLMAEIYERKEDTAKATKYHKQAVKTDPLYQYNYYILARYYFRLERYSEAAATLAMFDSVPKIAGFNPKKDGARERTQEAVVKLKESCKIAMEDAKNIASMNIQNMGPNINTKDWEYWPGMTIDGKSFIFTKMLNQQEDFYISEYGDSGWVKAEPLPGRVNTLENEGTISISADGRFIFFTVCNQEGFGSCDIFLSAYNAATKTWGKRQNLGAVINTKLWDAQPAISADGRTLIFSSARAGGYGGKDLWMSKYSNGAWSAPVNLGPNINTSDDDEAPYLHYDSKTLYFSSNGHPGYGAHDLYVSKKNPDGSWGKPLNMGKGINSSDDEMGLYVDRKGNRAYFVSTRDGGFGGPDIYTFEPTKERKPEEVSFVQGFVFDDETKKDLVSRIEIINLSNNEVILTDSSNYFFTTLIPGNNYALHAYTKGYSFYSANFQPDPAGLDTPFRVEANLQRLKNDVTIVLENIFFDVDKFDLKPESFSELNVVVELLKNNPTIRIEISGHTDNTGRVEHNLELSDNRAKSVVQYLVSKGISTKRIVAKGYGSEKPVADNNTDEGKAKNRRIEMRIISVE